MNGEKILALGIPTYKRPDFAIRAIKSALSMNIYDQIIVSSNSYEIELNTYLENNKRNNISFFQQTKNVGVGYNFAKLIELCYCKYLHIMSDEDYINEKNAKALRSKLINSEDNSLIITSINDYYGKIYKDATWQNNRYLKNLLGETAHNGSSIINVHLWTKENFKELYSYCERKGNIYIASAIAILSYSNDGVLKYFPPHIVEMGKPHSFGEISGYPIYGFKPRLHQFMSIFILIDNIDLNRKIVIQLYVFYYFAHHALHDSVRKFSENPITTSKMYLQENKIKTKEKTAIYFLISYYYYFLCYYRVIGLVGFILRKIKLKSFYRN